MRRFLPNRLSLNQSLLAAIPLSLVVAWLTGFWTCGAAFAMAALCVLAVRNPQQEFVERWPWLARVLSKSAASPQEESFTAPAPAPLPPPRRRVKRDSNSSPVEQMVAQGRANVAEKFGRMGLGTSSPGAIGAANYEEQSNADFMNILAQYTLQAQEYAANRQLTAATTAFQDFLSPALTMQGPKGSVAGAVLGSSSGGLETIALLRALGGFGTSSRSSSGGGS